ncbi:MAG: UV DNA damage repair endonuclease UvsE [Oligosphaeraceae bacterium]|nr:UV DNA damage repair endonuclease UvsE [Oligosphaeraceae bacterium]
MITWGLCCCFAAEPIAFRRSTAAAMAKYSRPEQLQRLSRLVLANAGSLLLALQTCVRLRIGAFRINSELFPLATHPQAGYDLSELPDAAAIISALEQVHTYSAGQNIRLSFHPDQFVVLNSPRPEVVDSSLTELLHQNAMARYCGAAEINLHGGGAYGDKTAALQRLRQRLEGLPGDVRARLTLENDDHTFTVADLEPLCLDLQVPLVYDVHHHRVNPDGLSIAQATALAMRTWEGRGCSPHLHLSSPAQPWAMPGNHRPHADYIDPEDIPECWQGLAAVIDVEAKAKELAILRLRQDRPDLGW